MDLISRIRNLIRPSQTEESRPDSMAQALTEVITKLHTASTKIADTLATAREQEHQLSEKVRKQQQALNHTQQGIKRLLKQGKEAEVSRLLNQKKREEKSVQHYKDLYEKARQHTQQLSKQQEQLQWRLEKVKLDKSLFINKLSQYKAQQEIAQQLEKPGESWDWDDLEYEINRTAIEIDLKLDQDEAPEVSEDEIEQLRQEQRAALDAQSLHIAEQRLKHTAASPKTNRTNWEAFFEETPAPKCKPTSRQETGTERLSEAQRRKLDQFFGH